LNCPGSLPSTKNHQGSLADPEDESDAKIFAVPESGRCPVKTVKNYLAHLNPTLDQRGRKSSTGLFIKKKQTKCTAPLVGSMLN